MIQKCTSGSQELSVQIATGGMRERDDIKR
jgi:hypothetical protein